MQAFVRVVLTTCALVAGGYGCGGSSGRDSSPDAPVADAAVADAGPDARTSDPLDAFSSATKDAFHLIVDGTVSDGRARVYWAPKVGFLQEMPRLLVVTVVNNSYVLSGRFDMLASVPGAHLQEEATAGHLALVAAELAMPRKVCAQPSLFRATLSLGGCQDAPRMI